MNVKITLALWLLAWLPLAPWTALAQWQPPLGPVRVMPLGDSLTSAVDGQTSYRYWLAKRLERSGFQVDFVGSQYGVGSGTIAPVPFDQDHEGHPGWRSDQVEAMVAGWAAQTQPEVVLLLLGANDLQDGYSVSHVIRHLNAIIYHLRNANPRVAVLLAQSPPIYGLEKKIPLLNAAIARLAVRANRVGSPVRLVNLYTKMDPARDTLDGTHLNRSGERRVANRWHNALIPILTALR